MNLRSCKGSCLLGMLLSLLPSVHHATAQVYPDFAWAAMGNSPSLSWGPSTYSHGVAVDKAGNSFVTGEFRESAQFGGTKLIGARNVFLAFYNPFGQLVWVRQSEGVLESIANSVAVDPQGSAFLTGSFDGICTFGGISLTNMADNYGNLFIAKYSKKGEVLWARQMGTTGDDEGEAIAVDGSGNALVTGVLNLTQFIAGYPETDPKLQRIYIAKYGADGEVIWEKKIGANYFNVGLGVGVDDADNVYVTGHFQDTNLFGPNTISGHGMFLVKYDEAGNLIWVRQAQDASVAGMAVDNQGNIHLAGSFYSSATFGTISLTGNTGVQNGFVAKHDTSGKALWAKAIRSSSAGSGGVYSQYVSPRSIAVDGAGNCYATGNFMNVAVFGTISLTNYITPDEASPNQDCFIAKYNSEGDFLWVRDVGRLGDEAGTGIAVDPQGNVDLTGTFGGVITLGQTTLDASGSGMFLTQLPALYLTALDRPVRFGLVAESGRECVIEYSRDLTRWFGLVTNTMPASGFWEFNHGIISVPDQLFYRARSLSP
ncbi:MAG: SBBP repeat-containing protein [Candidatus Omnitrophica bacterium]|nr:SBBP repeat-containing protein [Candidatus Omnitrophota bacterium]